MSRSAIRCVRPCLLPLALAWLVACSDSPTATPPVGSVDLALPWSVTDPEAVGLSADELYVTGELAGRIERLRSLLVVREGRLAFERYYGGWTADALVDVRSVTKSVVSMLAGVAVAQGYIRSLEQPITAFLPPTFEVRPEHATITVRHLLTMTGGFDWTEAGTGYNDWIASADPVQYLLDRSSFRYNSAAAHLLGVVIQEATGTPLPEYADRVLFEPLGIGRRAWEPSTAPYVNGGSGLDLRPRDLARLGQLMVQQGWSGSRSVVPAGWVEEATTPGSTGLGRAGPIDQLAYGYLWWIDPDRAAFFAWGYGGQFVYVAPDLDLVVVATTDWRGVEEDIGSARLQEEVLAIIVERIVEATVH